MKQYILVTIFIILFKTGFAQQTAPIVKYSFKGKKDPSVELKIYCTALYIQGIDGDELTIEPYNMEFVKTEPEDARGLTDITSITRNDPRNNSFDIPVINQTPQQVVISLMDTRNKALLIKLPRNIHFILSSNNWMQRQSEIRKISLKDLAGELEMNTIAAITELSNITGPLTLSSNSVTSSKVIVSHIKWDNASSIDKKLSLNLSANTSDIDISLPADLKATINVHANYGEIYSNLNLVKKYPQSNELNNFLGDLNGGGPSITINTNYGNVFLRKQQ